MENRGPKVFDSTRLDAYKRARAYPVDAASREHTAVPPTWAQTLLHFYHGRARTRYSDKHRLEMLKDRKNFNENPRPSAARPNVPFNSSSASVFFSFFSFFRFFVFSFFFFCFAPRCPPPTVSLSLFSSLLSSLSLSSPSLCRSPSFSPFFYFIRYVSVRERSAAAGHRKYISVEKVKRPPYVRHHSGRMDGQTGGQMEGREGWRLPWKKRVATKRRRERRRRWERGRDTGIIFPLVHVYFSRDYKRS